MKLKVYDEIEYEKDLISKSFYQEMIEPNFSEDAICYYKEPIYENINNIESTFTILDTLKGVFSIIIFDYSDEVLTESTQSTWTINGKKERNMLIDFADYLHKFNSDINNPTLNLEENIEIQKFAFFPNLSNEKVRLDQKFKGINIFTDNYRSITNIFPNILEINKDDFKIINSVIQKTDILKKDSGYDVERPIENLRDAIAYNNQGINIFDDEQLDASLTINNSSSKIRGLAGTGKTVILAIKAARLHKKYPDKKILLTFSTHSLYNQIIRLTKRYFYKTSGEYPSENLKIMHAWGGRSVGNGVYYEACINNGIIPQTVKDAKSANTKDAFDYVCSNILDKKIEEEYDFILLDEAQDMPVSFFKLLEKISVKPAKIVYAYDELQTINNITLPDHVELFGKDQNDEPKVKIEEKNDYVLKKTYRNHKNVLLTAIAFGFGFYSYNGLTQILQDKQTWEALGFDIDGELIENNKISISRSVENSPNNIKEIFPDKNIITFKTYNNPKDEIQFTIKEIEYLINQQNVKPEDIMVINFSQISTSQLRTLQNGLYEEGIQSTIPGVVDGARDFLIEDYVTLTTVRKARGNEVPIVFVIGLDNLYNFANDLQERKLRNMTFISITRAKAWLYLSGSGDHSSQLENEYMKIKTDLDSQDCLQLTYPSEEQINKIQSINILAKDSTKSEAAERSALDLEKLIESEDLDYLKVLLDDETRQKLIDALDNGGERHDKT